MELSFDNGGELPGHGLIHISPTPGCSPPLHENIKANHLFQIVQKIHNENKMKGSESMEENKLLKDYDTYDLIKELRSRDEIIGVTVWQREDIECALKDEGYIPTEERIDKVIDELGDCIEDCSHGWEVIQTVIWNCDFGDTELH